MKLGQKSIEGEKGTFKLYNGIAAASIVAVNPTKDEYKQITGRELKEEPVYMDKDEAGNKRLRLQFVLAIKKEAATVNSNIEDFFTNLTFFMTAAPVVGTQSGKYQIMDAYGNTAWATKEEFEAKAIPMYTNGPAKIKTPYYALCKGEEDVINFIRTWANLKAPFTFKEGKFEWKSEAELSECELNPNDVSKFFQDLTELKSLINLGSEYLVKVGVGVKTTDKGQYQNVFNKAFAKNADWQCARLIEALKNKVASDGSVEYSTDNIAEYESHATDFEKEISESEALPFGNSDSPIPAWL